MEHVFNVLEISWIWHVENVPHEFFHNLGGMSESSFVSPRRACVGKEQRVVPEVWADFAEIGCG